MDPICSLTEASHLINKTLDTAKYLIELPTEKPGKTITFHIINMRMNLTLTDHTVGGRKQRV